MSTPAAKTKTRVYRVYGIHDSKVDRLVRAANRSQAVRHVAEDTIGSRVATQDDVAQLISNGKKIEDASEEQ